MYRTNQNSSTPAVMKFFISHVKKQTFKLDISEFDYLMESFSTKAL